MRIPLVALAALLVVSSAGSWASEPQPQFLLDMRFVMLSDPAKQIAGAGGWLVENGGQRILSRPRLLAMRGATASVMVSGGCDRVDLRVIGPTRGGWLTEIVTGASGDPEQVSLFAPERRRVLCILGEQLETITLSPQRGRAPEVVMQVGLQALPAPPVAAAEASTAAL